MVITMNKEKYESFYVVKIGKGLYADTVAYNFYQSSTKHVANAKKFDNEYSAERYAKRVHGEVLKFYIVPEGDFEDEDENV